MSRELDTFMNEYEIKARLTPFQLEEVEAETERRGKKRKTAYWLYYFLGDLGAHRYYTGNYILAVLMTITFGFFGFFTLFDLFFLNGSIDRKNKPIEKEILAEYKDEVDDHIPEATRKNILKITDAITILSAFLFATILTVYIYLVIVIIGSYPFFASSRYLQEDILLIFICHIALKIFIIPLVLLVSLTKGRVTREKQLGLITIHLFLPIILITMTLPPLSFFNPMDPDTIFTWPFYVVMVVSFILFANGIYRIYLFAKQVSLQMI